MSRVAVATFAVLILPALVDAQSVGSTRGRVGAGSTPVTRPAPLPPLAPGISPMRVYRSSRLSGESYTFGALVHTDRYVSDTSAQSWSMAGAGTRIAWRFNNYFSATGDIVGATGGPFNMLSTELGTRFHPYRPDRVISPYVDVRGTWMMTYSGYVQPIEGTIAGFPSSSPYAAGSGLSRGFGAAVGSGIFYSVTRSIAIQSGLVVSRNNMTSITVASRNYPSNWGFHATTTRLILGFRYTPQQLVTEPAPLFLK